MNYSLHPEAQEDLRDAAEFYRDRAGNTLFAILAGRVRTIGKYPFAAPRTGFTVARSWPPSLPHEALSLFANLSFLFANLYGLRRRNSYLGCSSSQSPSRLLARKEVV